jgi:predicted nucleic acid-binding protein
MILFADSSALVKLYVDEPGSAQVVATLVTLHKRMDEEVQFACFDDRLVKAAEVLGVGSSPVR